MAEPPPSIRKPDLVGSSRDFESPPELPRIRGPSEETHVYTKEDYISDYEHLDTTQIKAYNTRSIDYGPLKVEKKNNICFFIPCSKIVISRILESVESIGLYFRFPHNILLHDLKYKVIPYLNAIEVRIKTNKNMLRFIGQPLRIVLTVTNYVYMFDDCQLKSHYDYIVLHGKTNVNIVHKVTRDYLISSYKINIESLYKPNLQQPEYGLKMLSLAVDKETGETDISYIHSMIAVNLLSAYVPKSDICEGTHMETAVHMPKKPKL